jgi:hypothetical protein
MPEYDVGVSSPGGPQSVDILSPNAKPNPFDLSGLLSNASNVRTLSKFDLITVPSGKYVSVY